MRLRRPPEQVDDWEVKYAEAQARNGQLEKLLIESEETCMDLVDKMIELCGELETYRARDQKAECEAAERAASPTHPDCMIGRQPHVR